MNLQQVKRFPLGYKSPKRVGRGESSGHGKTSGRGSKGAKQRTGSGGRIWWAGGQTPVWRRFPKRGFSNARFRKTYTIVHLGELSRFPAGTVVNGKLLCEAGILRAPDQPVKILSDGRLRVPLTVEADCFSEAAIRKIKAAGGEVRIKGERSAATAP